VKKGGAQSGGVSQSHGAVAEESFPWVTRLTEETEEEKELHQRARGGRRFPKGGRKTKRKELGLLEEKVAREQAFGKKRPSGSKPGFGGKKIRVGGRKRRRKSALEFRKPVEERVFQRGKKTTSDRRSRG